MPADLLDDLRSAINEVPTLINAQLQDVLLGVYFARAVGSSAITDVVVDPQGAIIGAVIVMDIDAFAERAANAWATWKENSPFELRGSSCLEVTIADPAGDTRANAIQFLLLHEYGHVLSTGRRFLPIWWLGADAMRGTADYAFLQLGWDVTADKQIVPKAGEDFAGRSAISYYARRGLADDAILGIYQALDGTSFATLYAATNVYDDFAETFATYVHSVLLGKPLRVRVLCDGAVHLQREHFWQGPASAGKRAFMERLLAA